MSSTTGHPTEYGNPVRPWTPPDTDLDMESQVRWLEEDLDDTDDDQYDSGYFGSALRDKASNLWAHSSTPSHLPSSPSAVHPPRIATPHLLEARGLGISHDQRPTTPVKSASFSNAPRYPYTPDSARSSVIRSHTFTAASPLPSMPWDSSPSLEPAHTSPVQNALFTCLFDLERLIHTSQPNDDQMAYIVEQFEAMTSFLSAPEAQSKQSDEHLFSELEHLPGGDTAQGISKVEAEAYVCEVGKFIAAVKKHAGDMEQRLEEVKQLNGIQLDVIKELRHELRNNVAKQDRHDRTPDRDDDHPPLETELEGREDGEDKEDEEEPKSSYSKTIWVAAGDALDTISDMLYEW
ncbi:hypothetical protein K491DRAFT_678462 [Lophiostoma macrostomum CBS 122681]|uniref:Uncharacterized protein n=1 Tax=Lophiostoma macrostomum CBS 122681 TaxID=1314788 RepID=A0A6A6T7I3_9PLEO|nr:hypothetical protein K491DRAFT_678462 [Lophiostoma macrostomum CBS 122681]